MILAGCAPNTESRTSAERSLEYANKSVEEAGRAVSAQTREATDTVNRKLDDAKVSAGDAGLTAKVKSILAADPLVHDFAIDVQSNRGIVTLRGEVKSDALRRRILEDAQSVDGVMQVNDQLTVKS